MKKAAFIVSLLIVQATIPLCAETVRVGVTLHPPLTTLDTRHGKPAGLFIDILEAVASLKGWQLAYQIDSRATILNKMQRGEIDLVVPAPIPLEGSAAFDYPAQAVISSHAHVMVLPNVLLASFTDLSGKTIAVVRDDPHYAHFQEALQTCQVRCQFVEMRNYDDVMKAVAGRRVDGGLVEHFYSEQEGKSYGLVSGSVTTGPVDFHFAVPHNRNQTLLVKLEEALVALKRQKRSPYYAALAKWTDIEEPLSPLTWGGIILMGSLAAACLIALVLVQVRSRIRRDTDKLVNANRHLLKTVDDHLRREEAAEAMTNWYRTLLNNTPDAILFLSVDSKGMPGKFLEANETACIRLGYSREELLSLSPHDIEVNPETAAPPYAKLLSQWKDARLPDAPPNSAKGGTLTHEMSFRSRSGAEIPGEVTLRILEHEGQPVVYYHIHDITGRRKAQQALKESERRFSDFFARSPIGVALYSPARELTDVNQAALAMFGFSERSAFSSARLLESGNLSPESQSALMKGGTVRYESVIDFDEAKRGNRFQSSRGGKSHFDILVTNLGLDQEFQPKGYMVQLQDLTEHRRAEEALHQHERMLRQAQKMEAIGTLAGGIAHDFNNILTPIIGYTEMALLTAAPGDPIRSDLEEILKASHRAKELVKQILTFSRQTEQEVKPLRLVPLVKEVMQLLRGGSVLQNVELRSDFQVERDIVKADPTQMHQVIMNLCTNAIHAMKDKGGVLEVGMRQVAVDSRTRGALARLRYGAYTELYVRDTGHGMDRAVMDRIFEPFFTTKRSGEGTGMGLAVTHGIITAMHGIITVESELGKGTTFRIFLPLVEQVAEQAVTTNDPLPRGHEKILFVDDEPGIVTMVSQMLTSLGYQVTTAVRPQDALGVFRQDPARFDLVITDQIMPGMTGLEMVREMHHVRGNLPVLLCTGFSKTVADQDMRAEGIQQILMKPIVLRQVAESIRKTLDAAKAPKGA